jgi:hypothetical protein
LTGSLMPNVPSTWTPTTQHTSDAPSPTASPQKSQSAPGWTTAIGRVAPEAPATVGIARPGETRTTRKATDHPATSRRRNGWLTSSFEAPAHHPTARRIKLHNHDINSVFRHPIEPLLWLDITIIFDRRDH